MGKLRRNVTVALDNHNLFKAILARKNKEPDIIYAFQQNNTDAQIHNKLRENNKLNIW